MRTIFLGFSMLILFLIDQTLLPFVAVYESYGSLLFTFMGLFIMQTDYDDAFVVGLLSGLLQDLYFPYVFGLHTLLNVLLFTGLSRIGLTLKEGKKTVPVLSLTLAQGIKTAVIIAVLYVFGIGSNYMPLLIMPLYTLLLSMLFYKRSVAYSRIPIVKKEWRF